MKHSFSVRIGPVGFRIGSAWRSPVEQLTSLYSGYPLPWDGIPDFTVRLEPDRALRRWIRPSVRIDGDYMLPEAAPLALRHGLLAAEMGMNLQMALGQRRFLLLHAAVVERGGRALIITGESGAGKSTLAALLGERGWRLMGDEFALLDPLSGLLHPFPRAISLKNAATGLFPDVSPDRWGPLLVQTPKGEIRHLRPDAVAVSRMEEPASPALILFPRFGFPEDVRNVGQAEVFVRLTQASTNYITMGEAGFSALTRLILKVPARAIDYSDGPSGITRVEEMWSDLAA